MANEISSRVTTQVSAPVPKSGQFAKLSTVNVPDAGGQTLPETGNNLPRQAGNEPTNSTQLKEAVSQINDFVQNVQRDLSFSLDESSGRTVIKVVDSGSGELVRQIPSEEVIALATVLQDVNTESSSAENVPTGILFSEST